MTSFASTLSENVNPDLALAFNPFNLTAKLNKFNARLDAEDSSNQLNETADEIRKAIRLEPFNAQLFALLGFTFDKLAGIEAKNGKADDNRAQKLFDFALKLNQADLIALFAKLQYYSKQENPVDAIKIAALIFQAWPMNADIIAPALPSLLSHPEAYEIAKTEFAKQVNGPRRLALSLINAKSGLEYAARLLIDWKRMGIPGLRQAINEVTWNLIRQQQYFQAYSLFLFTHDEKEESEAGYVFNHNFKLKPNGNPFDWRLPSEPGLSTEIVPRAQSASNEQDASGGNALEIKFLNAPIRLDVDLQFLRLPKTSVVWETSYSTKSLQTPKPVKLSIICINDRRVLASFDIEPTGNKQTSVKFDVPATNCDLQIIKLSNENLVESWKNRYSGTLTIPDMSIRLAR